MARRPTQTSPPPHLDGVGPFLAVVTNQKGGTSKTTTAVHIAHAWARRGLRVMLIDIDPQGHVAELLGIERTDAMTRVARGDASLVDVVVEARPGLFVAAANRTLVSAEQKIASDPTGIYWLGDHREALSGAGFDAVVIDCPPNLGSFALGAYVLAAEWIKAGASGGLVVPVVVEPLAVVGVGELLRSIAPLQSRGMAPDIVAIVPSDVDQRRTLTREVLEQVEAAFPGRVSPSVRASVRVPEASGQGQTLFETDPSGKVATDFEAVARFLLPS